MMRDTIKFNLANDDIESQIRDLLATKNPIKKEAMISGQLTYYDTFDWRLYEKSLVLLTFQDRMFLRELGREKIIHSLNIKPVPRFIWEFPKGDLKQYLEPVIKVRRLLKLVNLDSYTTPYHMLNKNEKTVARLFFETIRTQTNKDPKTIGRYLQVKPVKGYLKYLKRVKSRVEGLGLTPNRSEDAFSHAMREAGRNPGSYSAKLRLQFTPDMRADEATINILRFLLHIMKVNEAQIENDIDTEILHDFRVAVRRTRSALCWKKNIFSKEITTRFKKDFLFVGKISNELRDLDVYLLNKPKYKAMLPAALRDDIDPLFDYLGKQRSVSFRKVLRSLNTQKYKKIMQDWDAFLNEPLQDVALGSNAVFPVIDLAGKRIYKQYKTVVTAGLEILENRNDEALHKLRIQCKRLRYLIQFFANLFPPRKINPLIEQLKTLQDMLGKFNDLSVQVRYLLKVTKNMPAKLSTFNKTLVAIGSLIGKLENKRQTVKKSFTATFTLFSSSQNQKQFRDLFARQSKQVFS